MIFLGAEKLHSTMNVYVKSVSQKSMGEDREKMLPVDVMAQAMISHGEEFESDSVFGNCLISMFAFFYDTLNSSIICSTDVNFEIRNGSSQRENCQSSGFLCCRG